MGCKNRVYFYCYPAWWYGCLAKSHLKYRQIRHSLWLVLSGAPKEHEKGPRQEKNNEQWTYQIKLKQSLSS